MFSSAHSMEYSAVCWMNNAIHQEFVLFYLMTHKQHLILLVINSNEFECFVDFNEKQIIIYVTKRKEKKTIGVACFAWIILWRFFSSYFSSGKLTWWSWRIEVNKLSILFLLLLHGCFQINVSKNEQYVPFMKSSHDNSFGWNTVYIYVEIPFNIGMNEK